MITLKFSFQTVQDTKKEDPKRFDGQMQAKNEPLQTVAYL